MAFSEVLLQDEILHTLSNLHLECNQMVTKLNYLTVASYTLALEFLSLQLAWIMSITSSSCKSMSEADPGMGTKTRSTV